jgi:hypothetical protein
VDTPEGLSLARHRDHEGLERRPWARRALVGLLCAVLALGLLDVFGQRRVESAAETPEARFRVSAPAKLRGGLYFEARFRVEALEEIENAVLVLEPGWLEDITLNTLAPAPVEEESRGGGIALTLGRIERGGEHVLHLHFQVNPTAVGRRSQAVRLLDGERELAALDRDVWIWP